MWGGGWGGEGGGGLESKHSGSVLDGWSTGRTISPAKGAFHNKIQLISAGCPRSSIALQVQNHDLKHHSFLKKWYIAYFNAILLSYRILVS